ncbi:hypothetical protein KDU71_22540, partial [Carboxylicivirga sediminis]
QSPYEYRLSDSYAINDILASAWLSGDRSKEAATKQVQNLSHPDKIVRYWTAVGLRSQSKEQLQPFEKEIKQAMSDEYAPVAITAAAMAYNQFNSSEAQSVLKSYLLHENDMLALLTIHYLMYVDNKQPFVETVRASREMKGRTYNPKAAAVDFLGSLGLVPNNPSYRQ